MAKLFATPPHRPNRATFWANSFYNMRVDGLPAKADSQAIMDDTAAYHQNHGGAFLQFAPFGQAHWDAGYSSGYLVDRLPASMNPSTSRVTWVPNQPGLSMAGQHLYFNDLRQQGAVRSALTGLYDVTYFGDRHSILWSESSRELVETIGYNGTGPQCITVTTYNLDSYTLPLTSVASLPAGAIAARVPVAPFFFTYQDLVDCGETGDLGHMVGWTAAEYQTAFQWPARSSDGLRSSGVRGGEVIRLKSTFNLIVLPTAPLRALGRTLQRYGAMLFDKNGVLGDPAGLGRAWIVTCSDPEWTPAHRVAWGDKLGLNQFDAVDMTSISGANRSIAISGSPPSANPAPVAVITSTRADGKAPLAVSFSASGSSDNGSISSYAWDFGDSASSTGVTAAHTYSASGVYTARLTVTDNLGATASIPKTISAYSPPPSGNRCSPQTLVFSNSLSASGSATVWGVTFSSFAGVTTAKVGYGGSIAVSGSSPGTVPASGWSNPTLVPVSLPFITPRLAVNGGSAHVQKHILAPTGCGRYTIYIWSKPVGTTSMTAYYSINGTTWTAV